MTILETFNANFADNTMPISCQDTAAICTIGTDFIFDALNPACYSAGTLPSTGAAIPSSGLVNLARDSALGITEAGIPRGVVTAVESTVSGVSSSPTFDGKGWQIGVTKRPFEIRKVGIASNRVNEALLEGFKDNLVLVTFKIAAASSDFGLGIYATGRSGVAGTTALFAQNTGTNIIAAGATAGSAPATTLHQAGFILKYDTVAQTMVATPVFDGVVGLPISAVSIASVTGNDTNSRSNIGAYTGFNVASGNITIYRVVREYTGVTSMSATDIAKYVAKDYAYASARFA